MKKFLALVIACFSIVNVYAQLPAKKFTVTGKYIKDILNTCKVWDANYQPSDSVYWDGQVKNGYAEGTGVLTWRDSAHKGMRYIGTLKGGKANGKGKYLSGYSTDIEEGNYIDGRLMNIDDAYAKELDRVILPTPDTANLNMDHADSNTLFYYILTPRAIGIPRGILMLIPNYGETCEEAFNNSIKLCEVASDSGLAVVIPSLNNHWLMDASAMSFLNYVYTDVVKKHRLAKVPLSMGGMSLGGTLAFEYAERGMQDAKSVAAIPRSVFAGDPPLDLASSYTRWKSYTERKAIVDSDVYNAFKYLSNSLNAAMGGTPDNLKDKYVSYSAYSRSEPDGGNAKLLKDIPVRVYCDPDIDMALEQGNSIYDMNLLNETAFINQLNLLGNDQAQFINALGKGHTIFGVRNPHSWSIIDARVCVPWIMKTIRQ